MISWGIPTTINSTCRRSRYSRQKKNTKYCYFFRRLRQARFLQASLQYRAREIIVTAKGLPHSSQRRPALASRRALIWAMLLRRLMHRREQYLVSIRRLGSIGPPHSSHFRPMLASIRACFSSAETDCLKHRALQYLFVTRLHSGRAAPHTSQRAVISIGGSQLLPPRLPPLRRFDTCTPTSRKVENSISCDHRGAFCDTVHTFFFRLTSLH